MRADFWRRAAECATPSSPARPSRTPGRAPRKALQVSLVGLLTFQDARSPGLHRLALLSSTFRRHPALPLAAELSNFSPSMTRNPRFLVTINTR
ncbi:hypothetical protein MXAN_3608 [Myxococcus xanthus DK 1622]|uniref:Uncharacterized protein n=1 Tax=Myxococcus xanthus (strain DK1622) TaxID=246197 RepID=Q1D6C7_MYXXD|nr:hypothetical protein MXAN_3608 [Myxococcus xanthus DK 1622]